MYKLFGENMKENEKLSLIKYLLSSAIIGTGVGLMLTIYRLMVKYGQVYSKQIYNFGRQSLFKGFIIIILFALVGMLVGYFTKKDPKIGGSGIPQVTGQIKDIMKVNWKSVLPLKFFGGFLALVSGLTVGREGPSVQMGASFGQAYGELGKLNKENRKIFITAGAAAGLSAAFNAPISGLMFVLEELQQRFNKLIFISALVAASCAAYVGDLILGADPVINIGSLSLISLSHYPLLILLGVIIGFLAPIFTMGIYYTKKLYGFMKIPTYVKVAIPFVITAVMILLNENLFGSGEPFIFLPISGNYNIYKLFNLLILKAILLFVAFSSGMPGGIFLPMLVFGSLIGNIYGQIMSQLGLIGREYIIFFSVLAMCANFAAIVRSPITAIFLLLELTASFTYFLPIGLVVLSAYIVAECLKLKPVYELLLELQLKDNINNS